MREKVLIVIPAFNEQKTVCRVIQQIQKLYPQYDVVVINDGSSDDTSNVVRKCGAMVIDLPHNLGIGGAMQTGYLFAYRNGYDIVVQVDADGQHKPEELPVLLEPILHRKANLVVGSRYLEKTAYRSSWSRRVGMLFFSGLVTLITGQRFTDTTSGFRASDRNVIAFYAEHYPTDYPEVEALVLLRKNGFRIQEVSVEMDPRQAGASSITPMKSVYYMIKVALALFINILRPPMKGEKKFEI